MELQEIIWESGLIDEDSTKDQIEWKWDESLGHWVAVPKDGGSSNSNGTWEKIVSDMHTDLDEIDDWIWEFIDTNDEEFELLLQEAKEKNIAGTSGEQISYTSTLENEYGWKYLSNADSRGNLGFVTDYDNTLYVNDNELKNAIKELNRIREKDIKVVISTGRSIRSIKNEVIKHNIPFDYLSCADGSLIYDNNYNLIKEHHMDKDIIKEIPDAKLYLVSSDSKTEETIKLINSDMIVSGSYINMSDNFNENIKKLKEQI